MVNFLKESQTKVPAGQIVYPEIFPIRYPDRLPQNWPMRAGYFCIDTSTPITSNVFAAATPARRMRPSRQQSWSAPANLKWRTWPAGPGHHAERKVFGGFCYFNNAALAANALSRKGAGGGARRGPPPRQWHPGYFLQPQGCLDRIDSRPPGVFLPVLCGFRG